MGLKNINIHARGIITLGAFLDIILILNETKTNQRTQKKNTRESKIQTSCGQLYTSFILTLAQNITGKMLKQTYMYT